MKKIDLAALYVDQYQGISKSAIAEKLVEDYPALFSTKENARSIIKKATNGVKDYSLKKDGTLAVYNIKNKIDHIAPKMPPTQISARKFVNLPQIANNILWLSDVHIPNQDNKAIELAIDYGVKNKINCVVLGGDILDNTPFTSHDAPPPSAKDVRMWFEYVQKFLEYLRHHFPTAHIVWLEGNHDNWYVRYLMKKAPVLFEDPYYRIPQRLDLKKYNVEFYEQNIIVRAGKLHLAHGHTMVKGVFAPVNAARGVFLRSKSSMLIGHVHTTSNHSETTIKGEQISTWSTGCLCTLAPDYDPHNTKHNLGFAQIIVEKNGNFIVENKRIINNKIY